MVDLSNRCPSGGSGGKSTCWAWTLGFFRHDVDHLFPERQSDQISFDGGGRSLDNRRRGVAFHNADQSALVGPDRGTGCGGCQSPQLTTVERHFAGRHRWPDTGSAQYSRSVRHQKPEFEPDFCAYHHPAPCPDDGTGGGFDLISGARPQCDANCRPERGRYSNILNRRHSGDHKQSHAGLEH
jgi:hypothetical protein